MTTTWEIFSPVIFPTSETSPSISPARRFRCRPSSVEAQNLQPMRQPTWEEMQTLFPKWYFMNTASTRASSSMAKRNFCVPSSFEICRSTMRTPLMR